MLYSGINKRFALLFPLAILLPVKYFKEHYQLDVGCTAVDKIENEDTTVTVYDFCAL